MTSNTHFISATPVLASLDIQRSVEFFCSKLGFTQRYAEQGAYGVITRGDVSLHFWACTERHIAENTSCRLGVKGIDALFALCTALAIVHPKAALADKPWGAREFSIVDPDGNLVTFSEATTAETQSSANNRPNP